MQQQQPNRTTKSTRPMTSVQGIDSTHAVESTHNLECQFTTGCAIIERLLRVIRVRGFHLDNMELHLYEGIYKAYLTINGERAVENLRAQLEKLADMLQVEVRLPDQTPMPKRAKQTEKEVPDSKQLAGY